MLPAIVAKRGCSPLKVANKYKIKIFKHLLSCKYILGDENGYNNGEY